MRRHLAAAAPRHHTVEFALSSVGKIDEEVWGSFIKSFSAGKAQRGVRGGLAEGYARILVPLRRGRVAVGPCLAVRRHSWQGARLGSCAGVDAASSSCLCVRPLSSQVGILVRWVQLISFGYVVSVAGSGLMIVVS